MRFECGAATRHAPGLGTAQVTRREAGADEPYEGILHVRVCGGRRGQPRPLPGTERGRATSVGNADALGHPRRSVHALADFARPHAIHAPRNEID